MQTDPRCIHGASLATCVLSEAPEGAVWNLGSGAQPVLWASLGLQMIQFHASHMSPIIARSPGELMLPSVTEAGTFPPQGGHITAHQSKGTHILGQIQPKGVSMESACLLSLQAPGFHPATPAPPS